MAKTRFLDTLPDLSTKWLDDEIGRFITLRYGDPQAAMRWFAEVATQISDPIAATSTSVTASSLTCSTRENHQFPDQCFRLDGISPGYGLYPYQAFVLRFALYREVNTYKSIRGGILNLFPGLGKTLCLLSMIWSTYTSARVGRRPTLVVVPTSVVYEWRANVLKFFGDRMPFFVMDKNWNNPTDVRNVTMAELMTYPLIITTYPVLRSVYRRCGAEKECVLLSDDGKVMGLRRSTTLSLSDAQFSLQRGPACLYRLPFARVAFDESQAACNPKTITFQSCYSIPAETRWCLTGMPLRNKSLDLFGQLLIVGLETPKRVSMSSAQEFYAVHKALWKKEFFREQKLSHTMLTLTYKDTHLKMPEMRTVVHPVLMNDAERSLYELFAQTARSEYQKFEQGSAPLVNVLTCVTRMRQACDCPYLLHLSDLKKRENRRNIAQKARLLSQPQHEKGTGEITANDILNEDDDDAQQEEPALITEAKNASVNGGANRNTVSTNVLDPVVAALGPAAAQWCRTWNGTGGRLSSKVTAIVNLVRNIIAGAEERPTANHSGTGTAPIKVIVYSAFAQMLHALGRALADDAKLQESQSSRSPNVSSGTALPTSSLKHCIMTGATSAEERTRLLDLFRLSNTHNVIFMTYKVGSLGLTLTEASHVIFTEPWFCYEVHLQALYRAYRIGQRRNVSVHWMISHAPDEENGQGKTQSLSMIEWRVLQIASRKIQMTNELIAADLVADVPKNILEFMGTGEDVVFSDEKKRKSSAMDRSDTAEDDVMHQDTLHRTENAVVSNTADTLRSVLFPERYATNDASSEHSTKRRRTHKESFLVSTQ